MGDLGAAWQKKHPDDCTCRFCLKAEMLFSLADPPAPPDFPPALEALMFDSDASDEERDVGASGSGSASSSQQAAASSTPTSAALLL